MIELSTILIEVEAISNSHPLAYPYVSIDDASPLLPSHFLSQLISQQTANEESIVSRDTDTGRLDTMAKRKTDKSA